MEKESIANSIIKEKLQLNLFETIKYYKFAAMCIFVCILLLTNGFRNFSEFKFHEIFSKLGFLFMGLGIISFTLKLSRLKLILVEHPILKVKEEILNLAEKRNWKIELDSEKAIILKTVPIRGYDEYLVYDKHGGEKIYIFFNQGKVFVKSIDNLESTSFKIQNGENGANERAIVNTITQAIYSGL